MTIFASGTHVRTLPFSSAVFPRCAVFLLILFLCACTTTVQQRPVNSSNLKNVDPPHENEKALKNLSVEDLIRNGNGYLSKGNNQLAGLNYSVALKKDPESTAAYAGIGEILRREGKLESAREAFGKGLDKDPLDVPSMLGVARTYGAQGDYKSAAEHLNKALARAPEDTEVLTELAISLDAQGQEPQAEPLYLKVIEMKPRLASGHNNLGFNYLLQGRYPEAISAFTRAVGIESHSLRIQNNLAVAYALNGNDEKALRIFEKTVGKASAYNNIGYILMTQGEWEKAERAFKSALDFNPTYYARAQENLDRLNRMRKESAR